MGEEHAPFAGAEIELGQTRIRCVTPCKPLQPKCPCRKDHHHKQSNWRRYLPSPKAMLLLGLVCAWNLGSRWFDSPPSSPWSGYFDDPLATLGFAALWAAPGASSTSCFAGKCHSGSTCNMAWWLTFAGIISWA